MRRSLEALIAATLLLAGAALSAPAQEAAKPAQDPAKKEELEATIVALKGTVDVKRPGDKDWIPAERNMKLKKGSEICTAVASTAKILFSGNIQVDVKALTQAKVEDLAKAGGKVNADVNLKFGSVEVDIQKGDLKADMKVTAPNSTTSVSGSHGIVRAPAKGGGGTITLNTKSGTWTHYSKNKDTDQEINGAGKANDDADTPHDRYYKFNADQYLNFFGKDKDELFQGPFSRKAGDLHPWEAPLWWFGQGDPGSPKHRKASGLPLPPPPPSGP